MDEISSAQAREHVELAERILAQSSRRLRVGGEFFIILGIYSAAILVMQLVVNRQVRPVAFWALLPVLVALASD